MARYDDEAPREPLLSGYQRERLLSSILGIPSAIGGLGYEMFRDVGIPGTPLNFKSLVAGARSLGNSTFDEEMENLRQYDLENPSLRQRAYQMSEVDPSKPAFGEAARRAAEKDLILETVLGTVGGGAKGPTKLPVPRRPKLAPGESQAGFKLPSGDVYETGAFHDITKLPEPYSLGDRLDELISGHIDDTGAFMSKEELKKFIDSGELPPKAPVIGEIKPPADEWFSKGEVDNLIDDLSSKLDESSVGSPTQLPKPRVVSPVLRSEPEGLTKLDPSILEGIKSGSVPAPPPGTTQESVFSILQMMKKNYPDLYKKFLEFNRTNPMPEDL